MSTTMTVKQIQDSIALAKQVNNAEMVALFTSMLPATAEELVPRIIAGATTLSDPNGERAVFQVKLGMCSRTLVSHLIDQLLTLGVDYGVVGEDFAPNHVAAKRVLDLPKGKDKKDLEEEAA